jgi:hypothetical protein
LGLELHQGVWVDGAIVPGMGTRRVWVPYTDAERRAAGSGLLTYSKAAEMLGHSRGWVMSRTKSGTLQEREWMGRTYVTRGSVDRALASLGYPSGDEQKLERLEELQRAGVGVGQRLPDLAPRDVEGAGDLPDGHAIAVRRADFGVVVHRTHVLASVRPGDPEGTPANGGGGYGGSRLLDHRCLR